MCFACGSQPSSSFFHDVAADAAAANRTVADHTALFAGASWVDRSGVLSVRAQPAFVTFSFPTRAPDHVEDAFGSAANTWERFSEAEEALARRALAQWADASGIVFLEVEDGKGDIQFNWMNFNRVRGHEDALAFAYYPNGQSVRGRAAVERFSDLSGDVFLNAAERSDELAGRSKTFFVLLHEIGHALGLKHPFEASPANPNVLSGALDNHSKTVMSYTGDEKPMLGVLDRAAVKALYGGPSADGSHLQSWTWNRSSETLVQIGKSGDDHIVGVSVRDDIKGQAGDDTISGLAGDDLLSGGAGDDLLLGGDGNDTLRPGIGEGVVYGGDGRDILDFSDLRTGISVEEDGISDEVRIGEGRGADNVRVSDVEVFIGTDRDDVFVGSGYEARAFIGGDGDDRFVSGFGNDTLDGGRGFDIIDFSREYRGVSVNLAVTRFQHPGLGSDTLISIEGAIGTDWDDRLIAGRANAVLEGHGGDDVLIGNAGDDHLDGGLYNDTLDGRGGDDMIVGGGHDDILIGGSGNDTFVLETDVAVGGMTDRILDFEDREEIHLVADIYLELPEGRLSADRFCVGPVPADADDRVIYDPRTGVLSIWLPDAVFPFELEIATLDRGLDLTASHFLIV